MEPGTLLRRILLIIMFLRVSASSSAAARVNGSARLSCSKPCSGEVKCVYAKGHEILVIMCKQGSCVEGDAFKNRTELTFSEDGCCLQLNNIQYSDDGMYVFSCDKSELCRKSLDVLAPVPVHAAVGENVTFPCYAHTNKIIADRDIMYRCEKDGELVVALQQGNVLYGPGFDISRVSMSLDKYKNGDLSLTISNVQPSDAGTYRCVPGKECWGVTYTPEHVCALKDTSIDLSCSYKHPAGHTVIKSVWFFKEQAGVDPEDVREDKEYQGRVQYTQSSQNNCSLRITNLRERDSQTYRFRFYTDDPNGKYTGQPGVSLSVTGNAT
ncbi:hypothetical protein PGIGA_G00157070 [Pangasianodon gigas]|uniref:Uncharacterized protein n=1 Tax=Pangasianodon gigas TaxID=30993 RepID=A0ACC5XQJ3_PANGG|nr:hypothetical protein [Pangasianodon gigas]